MWYESAAIPRSVGCATLPIVGVRDRLHSATDQFDARVAEHRRQRFVDVDQRAVVGVRQRHPGRCAVEGCAESCLGEIEILRLAQATGDVAQRHHDRSGITYRHMNIGFEKDLVTVGMIEREHRAADRCSRTAASPRLRAASAGRRA